MEIVRRTALAPADPSPRDIRVAQIASLKEMKAKMELIRKELEENTKRMGDKNSNLKS
ncbi:MAG: hypothetical protein ACPL0D_05180 [Thermosulfidibacteraceae bacterium]|jgi:hypothetical protein